MFKRKTRVCPLFLLSMKQVSASGGWGPVAGSESGISALRCQAEFLAGFLETNADKS